MMRKRNIPNKEVPESKYKVADFFQLEVSEVISEPQPDTFTIHISLLLLFY